MNQKQIGFTASKKVGNAVKRNFAKRRLRAIFAEYSNNLNDGTYIFVAKHDIIDIKFSKLKNDIYKSLKRLGAIENDKRISS